jgi:protein arginine kinase
LYDYVHFKDQLLPALETRHGETEHVERRPGYLSNLKNIGAPDRVRLQRAIQDALSESDRPKLTTLCQSLLQLEQEDSSPARPPARASPYVLLDHPGEWLQGIGPESDVIVSSRVRLARNLAYFRFPSRLSPQERGDLLRQVTSGIAGLKDSADLCYCDLEAGDALERQFLVERQLISQSHAVEEGPRAVFFDRSEKISILINEEDHLRVQATGSGFSLKPLLHAVEDSQRRIEDRFTFAYHPRFGYAASSLKNTGTGLRVSVLIHLPAVAWTRQIDKVLRALQKINCLVRGLYGEGSRASGNFYQLANGATLGTSEERIVEAYNDLILQVVAYEREARTSLVRQAGPKLKDRVARAYDALRASSSLTADQGIDLLSSVRLGIQMGLIKELTIPVLNQLLLQIQPVHLQKTVGAALDSEAQNVARARFLGQRLPAVGA